jgi:hypothetical protein
MRKILKVVINILAVLCLFYTLCGDYILAHYYPESFDANGNMTLLLKISLLFVPLAFISAFWLSMQYGAEKIFTDLRSRFRFF